MIRFDGSMMYYLGCTLLCVVIVLVIVFLMNLKKMMSVQKEILDQCGNLEYQLMSLNDQIHDIDNEVLIMSRRGNAYGQDR